MLDEVINSSCSTAVLFRGHITLIPSVLHPKRGFNTKKRVNWNGNAGSDLEGSFSCVGDIVRVVVLFLIVMGERKGQF